MPKLTESNVPELLARFRRIPADAAPQWGKMTAPQMFGHVNNALRYSMGYGPEMPFKGNWKTRYIFAPMILNGWKQIPRNVRLPRPKNLPSPAELPTADVTTLEASLGELIEQVRTGVFDPPHHPFFGTIGPKGWMKFHAAHLDHHLRQFGV